jgi:energy-coupling factor transporter ATP-binding protein EcfA2
LLASSPTERPLVHLFDEPQFNPQDGYIGFMLDFFKKLARDGKLVFICLHPTASYHLEILSSIADRFLLVSGGKVIQKDGFAELISDERCRTYLGTEMYDSARKLT